MLTRKQHELLAFIRTYQAEHEGVSPSFIEMRDAMGLGSKAGVFRLLSALEERGFIRRLPNRARALEIIETDDEAARPLGKIADGVLVAEICRRGLADRVAIAARYYR